ncbi:kinase-like domain-containing protein, partial [Triangularia verruculosa]
MGLILWPAAEGGDLRHYLHSSIDRDHELLRRLFGCLSIGLNFLSSTCNLRHNDIKTSNILIHESHVLFTDFGSAKKFEDRFGITEGAKTGTSTRLYAAPEILNMGPRNIKTDLFALGCIFAEVLTVMGGRTVKNLHDHMRKGSKGSEVQYGENVPRLREWLHGCYGGKEDLRIPLAWCLKMIVKDVDERPHLVNLIQDMRKNC